MQKAATIILLTILTALPLAATSGQMCQIGSAMDCCIDEAGCPMPMHESDTAMTASDGCAEMCECTFERRQSPVAAPAENRQTIGHSTATIPIIDNFPSARERHNRNIRPPLIDDRGDTYLHINCFRI